MKLRYVLVRIGHAIVSILVLTFVVFFLVRLTGDPAKALLPDLTPPEVVEAMRVKLGLDKPLYEQYLIFITGILRGDLGTSFVFRLPVSDLIAQRFPNTLMLAIAALFTVVVIGVPLGIFAAYHRGRWPDRVASWTAVIGQSVPAFWVGLILIFIFAIVLKWLPAGGTGGPANFIMPALVMAVFPLAGLVRLLRSSMIETLETDYVKFLRLKGVPERTILWKHGLRNAGLTTLTFVGLLSASLLAGSVIAETVFSWPGMGWLISESIVSKDFAVVQGVVLVFSVIYIVMNLLTDLAYGYLNPRLR